MMRLCFKALLFMFLMRCGDPTGNTCVDRHGFLSLALALLFGLPIGATVGGWSGYHLVGRPTSDGRLLTIWGWRLGSAGC
jgi:hypothetical protein